MKFLIAIPAYNEEEIIQETLLKLDYFLQAKFPEGGYRVVVSDNNSNDKTRQKVEEILPRVCNTDYHFVPQQGKGVAIKSAWEKYLNDDFDLFIFMDADLATDLEALPNLIEKSSQCDLCLGNRYDSKSIVERTVKRKIISHGYRLVVQILLNSDISDIACGFKAVRKEALREILPLVENMAWFFDHELAYLGEQRNFTIAEVPVRWRDPRTKIEQSKIKVIPVSFQFLREIIRLKSRAKEFQGQ